MQHAFRLARDYLLSHRDDYELACRCFQWPKLERFNWALDWFDEIAASPRGDQLALWVEYESGPAAKLSFRELSGRSNQVANYFRELGIRRYDRVLVMLGNIPELWETALALIKLGAVIVPTATLVTDTDLADRIKRGGVRVVVCSTECIHQFDRAGAACTRIAVGEAAVGWHTFRQAYTASADFRPDGETLGSDPIQLYFTSGTTSRPKFVLQTHVSYPVGHLSTMYLLGLQPGDVHCNISSPGWAKHAWSCFFTPWTAEATVFMPNQSRFHAGRLLEAITRARVTSLCAPATVWRMLVTEPLQNFKTSLRELISAGEPINPEIIKHVQEVWGLTIREGYGQTETTALAGNSPGLPVRPPALGKSMPGFRLELRDASGQSASEGELCVLLDPPPVGIMPGYLNDSGEICTFSDGVHHTGDVMSRDADGYLTFIGRIDDVFKASDYRISPFELESALIEHPDVVECAVVPSPDSVRLAVPKAFIVLRPGAEPTRETALSIFLHIRKTLATFKRVRRIEFSQLPKTISGKIRRVELRRQEQANASGQRRANEFREEEFPELTKPAARSTETRSHGSRIR